MMLATLKVLLLSTAVVCVNGYSTYQERIPNGDSIPHSCKPNYIWKGVGHFKQAGGGERNQFGKDFHAADKQWTKELCEKDSDGDGKSNGVELGDPGCIWTSGAVPQLTTGISHPGICDPWGSSECQAKNAWVNCDEDVFVCPAIDEEGVLTKELRYPLTNVPAQETTYMCMSFELPSDADYHMIATTPIINETRVMHHIFLFGCDDDAEALTEPQECSMGLRKCGRTIGLWGIGMPGECLYQESGFRIGLNGMKKAVLQFHWTNPEKRTDLWDSSGMKIYYTKNLRKYDSASMMIGQNYLEIPPLSPKVVQHSTCSAKCTRKLFNESIFLTTGMNHMHYLGVAEHIKLKRSDGSELMLTKDEHYSYDTPVINQYDPPIEIKPGDTMETVCTFRSMSRKDTTFWGLGTFDEMCFGLFSFYPAHAAAPIVECHTYNDFDLCDIGDMNCNFDDLFDFSRPDTSELIKSVMDVCSYKGVCQHGCRVVVDNIRKTHNCFKEGIDAITFRELANREGADAIQALRFSAAMKSCDCATENPIEYTDIAVKSSSPKIRMSMLLLITGITLTWI